MKYMDETVLCPGFRPHHHGHSGLCCCGLYWEGEMPAHDSNRKAVPLERIERRAVHRAETDFRRRAEREAFARNQVSSPLGSGVRLLRWAGAP
jgi:hypothetical protein